MFVASALTTQPVAKTTAATLIGARTPKRTVRSPVEAPATMVPTS